MNRRRRWPAPAAAALLAAGVTLLAGAAVPLAAATGSARSAVVAQALTILPTLRSLDTFGPYSPDNDIWNDRPFLGAYDAAIRAGVPAPAREFNTWMTTGTGLTSPVRIVHWRGGTIVWANRCEPHDCFENQEEIIFAPGLRKVWGIARISHALYVFGRPTPMQQALAIALFGGRVGNSGNTLTFPLDRADVPKARTSIRGSGGNLTSFFPP